jgi:O-antigen ligase/tetratricopeptide (TPR) repeat protein
MTKIRRKARPSKNRPPVAIPRDRGFWISALTYAILLAAGIALFSPVIVDRSFFYSFIFLKSVVFRAAVEAMLLMYVLLATLDPACRPRLHLISYTVLAWFGAMLISSLPGISADAWSSWWGDFRRMGGMVAQLHLLAYFFVLAHTFKREREWVALAGTALFSGILMGFSGMLQYFGVPYLYSFSQQYRIEGAAGNANFFATGMLLNFFLALWLLGRKDRGKVYPVLAQLWLGLTLGLDVLLVGCDLFAGTGFTSGLQFNSVGIFAALLHLSCFCWFVVRRNIRAGEVLLAVVGGWCLLWVYLSQTRGAVVGLAGSFLIIGILYMWRGSSRRLKLLIAGAVLLMIMVHGAVLLNRQASWVQQHPTLLRYASLSLADASAENRLLAWGASAQALLDRPVFGWGVENYRLGFDLYFPVEVYRALTGEFWFDRAHNLIIDIGMTTGMAGLAAFLALCVLVTGFLVRAWMRDQARADALLILGFVLAYLFQGLFTFDTINSDPVLYLVLAYVCYLSAASGQRPTGNPKLGAGRPVRAWVPVTLACIVLPLAFYGAVFKPFQSNRSLQQARISARVRNPQTNEVRLRFSENTLGLFRRADDYQTTGRSEVREEAANYAFDLARAPYIPIDQKLLAIKEGVRLLRESITQAPANARSYQYLGSLVNGTFATIREADPKFARSLAEATLPALQEGEKLSPNRPQMYFEKSQLLLFLGRMEERLAAFEKGASLSKVAMEPHIDLVTLYIEYGRFDDATREWQNIKKSGFHPAPQDYARLIQAYEAHKRFASVAELCREQLAATPGNVELLTKLALSYRELGQTDLARQTALKAVSISPEAASSLQSLLKRP